MKKNYRFLLILISFNIIFYNTKSEVKLPDVFGDNMVLQQETEVWIWGTAKPAAIVEISVSWSKQKFAGRSDQSGKWKIQISTPAAGGPFEIKITDGDKPLIINNILTGEVWLCSGQSNMEMPMKGYIGQPITGSNDAILRSFNKNIRFITVPRAASTEPQDDFRADWLTAEPSTVSEFSATAWYFAKLLN
ncbi:MAG: sialate O-acetylesterase, partial [Bacteroidales bacterium]